MLPNQENSFVVTGFTDWWGPCWMKSTKSNKEMVTSMVLGQLIKPVLVSAPVNGPERGVWCQSTPAHYDTKCWFFEKYFTISTITF